MKDPKPEGDEPENSNSTVLKSHSQSQEPKPSIPETSEQPLKEVTIILESTNTHLLTDPYQNSDPPKEKESFESYYLRQITNEFADDIDKIRNAPDFTEKSVHVLVDALKQSGAHFTEEQQRVIMGEKE